MLLKNLFLQNFRGYAKKDFQFAGGLNLVIGPNTSGKTNLLEAVYLLATGKSFRADLERQMIRADREIARVKGEVQLKGKERLEIVLTTGQVGEERVAKKRYLLNGVGKRRMDFVGVFQAVLFKPEDLEIIIDSPSTRRGYLDDVLEQTDREYRRASLSYQKGLRQRNKLLEQIREESKPRSILYFWDKLLVENGQVISQKRQEFLDFVNQQPGHFGELEIRYHQSSISPERLEKYAREEVAAGVTLVGPHRDDFEFSLADRNLHAFGSRGEQRLAILSLKLAELEFFSQKTGQRPVLLLDDIFSELDQTHREQVFSIIPRQQTIITATSPSLLKKAFLKKALTIELKLTQVR